jgi:hypothetical protein
MDLVLVIITHHRRHHHKAICHPVPTGIIVEINLVLPGE